MDFKVLKKTKTTLEIEVDEKDPTLFNMIVERLNERDDVVFASFKWNHPLIENPVMYVEVGKGKDVSKVLEEVVTGILSDLDKVEKALK